MPTMAATFPFSAIHPNTVMPSPTKNVLHAITFTPKIFWLMASAFTALSGYNCTLHVRHVFIFEITITFKPK
jgi:hypothetical protein